MPIAISSVAGGLAHAPVFVGPILGTDVVQCDISDLTINEVDQDGFIKPGVPLMKDGSVVGASGIVWGVVIEPTKIIHATMPPTNVSLAADVGTSPVVVGFGLCNRDVMEDNLGRVLNANEIAGFDLAGSNCRITRT